MKQPDMLRLSKPPLTDAQWARLTAFGEAHDVAEGEYLFRAGDRDYDLIEQAGKLAADAVLRESVEQLADAVQLSYRCQQQEGMSALPKAPRALARKYCGGGWGGYAVYLFNDRPSRDAFLSTPRTRAIEPYITGGL